MATKYTTPQHRKGQTRPKHKKQKQNKMQSRNITSTTKAQNAFAHIHRDVSQTTANVATSYHTFSGCSNSLKKLSLSRRFLSHTVKVTQQRKQQHGARGGWRAEGADGLNASPQNNAGTMQRTYNDSCNASQRRQDFGPARHDEHTTAVGLLLTPDTTERGKTQSNVGAAKTQRQLLCCANKPGFSSGTARRTCYGCRTAVHTSHDNLNKMH